MVRADDDATDELRGLTVEEDVAVVEGPDGAGALTRVIAADPPAAAKVFE
ncbi:hypothetical protein ABZS76_28835 [Streptomyces sp. NPDC005562]